jgi:hypothetical protein
MGQVPQSTENINANISRPDMNKKKDGLHSILFIGNGKTAKHLKFYFEQLGYQIQIWHYKTNDYNNLLELFNSCKLCFLLIKDDALNGFVEQNSFLKSNKSFHCSGSVSLEGVRCLHPLMTFSENLYELSLYKKIHWAIFEENKKLNDYVSELNNPYFYVKPEQKILYHAMCVMSGNFTQLLLQQVLCQWQDSLHLSQDSLQPYLQIVLENFWKSGSKALTGPLARKDFGTIRKHLQCLQHSPQFDLYQSFLNLYLNEHEIKTCIEEANLEETTLNNKSLPKEIK